MFGGAQLGGERDLLEGIRLGTVQMAIGAGALANFAPAYNVVQLPFLIKNQEHMVKIADGPAGKLLAQRIEEQCGFKVLGYFSTGDSGIQTVKAPVRTPADLKGVKIRVMENPALIESMRALGANPTPLPFPEVYTSMKQGVVEGATIDYTALWTTKVYEAVKYVTEPGFHILAEPRPLLISAKFFAEPAAGRPAVDRPGGRRGRGLRALALQGATGQGHRGAARQGHPVRQDGRQGVPRDDAPGVAEGRRHLQGGGSPGGDRQGGAVGPVAEGEAVESSARRAGVAAARGLAGLLIGAITVLVTVQVFARYVLNDTPPWSEELCRYLFIWASFLGACVAMGRAAHLGVDSLVARLPARVREVVAARGDRARRGVRGHSRLAGRGARARDGDPALAVDGHLAPVRLRGGPHRGAHHARPAARASWPARGRRPACAGVALVSPSRSPSSSPDASRRSRPAAAVVVLIVTMVVLIAVNTPIAFAVGIACVVYVLLRGDIPMIVVPHRAIGGMDSFLLLAMPLFVLAGDLMNTGGITERLVGFARALVGHIRGGLGMTTVVSEYLFSGISGSSAADVSAVGSLLIPAMTRAGYRPELAVSIVAAASAMGVLVPPCLMMVVLASLTDLSVAALFMAGFLPAAAMALFLIALIYVQARRENLPREPRPSLGELGRACARGVLPLMAPVIILGGILGGIVTPTEAAVLAVIYALVLGLVIYREIRPRDLMPLLINTAALTGMVMLLVGTASVLSWIFAAQGIPRLIAGFLLGVSSGRRGWCCSSPSSSSCRWAPSSRACRP